MNKKKHELIPHTLEGEVIQLRAKDGYVHATAMCNAAGRVWNNYSQNSSTKAFAEALFADTGIPVSELIQSVRGGTPELQGTWVHPKVAIHLAQWLSPRFAVQVTNWVYEWMTEGAPKTKPELPFHLRRYIKNHQNLPPGHFSVLTEMTLSLIAPLELLGYTLPEKLWPDISEGRMFAYWLRNKGIEPNDLATYIHEFEDGRRSVRVIMLQATHDIRKVALWLGHADIRTTEVYLRMDPSEKLEAVEAVVPPELRRGRFKAPDALIASLLASVSPSP